MRSTVIVLATVAAGSAPALAAKPKEMPPWVPPPAGQTAADLPAPVKLPPPPDAIAKHVKLELVTNEPVEPVSLLAAPGDRSGRLFVVEKQGAVRLLRAGKLDGKPFLDLRGKVSLWKGEHRGEQGLLGMAFHPKFGADGERRFFINYTDLQGDTRVVEYVVDAKDPNRTEPKPRRELLHVEQPYKNHNGGHLAFGPDGKLYVGLGDGGAANDPHDNAQNPTSLLGKMLRLDVDAPKPAAEIVHSGLRNPWRYNFDPKTGDLYIADVGQNLWEWVEVVKAGDPRHLNFGWNRTEGLRCFQGRPCDQSQYARPVVEYNHKEGCSISGGTVYRGRALPALDGVYFYADLCTALVRSFRLRDGKAIDPWDWKATLDPESVLSLLVGFGTDADGELYVISHDGPIYKLVAR